ncbi:MAG: hypothetical protein IJL99_03085 [Firmicutes bacterium]|nr:hypothetical protein [Lachnospiraceae bacterium]MBR0127221.1 hypothetical protein [Bacillota bacterium]
MDLTTLLWYYLKHQKLITRGTIVGFKYNEYQVQIRAFTKANGDLYSGAWSKVKITKKIK